MRIRQMMQQTKLLRRLALIVFSVFSVACLVVLFVLLESNNRMIDTLSKDYGRLAIEQFSKVEKTVNELDVLATHLAQTESVLAFAPLEADEISPSLTERVLKDGRTQMRRHATVAYQQLCFLYFPRSHHLFDFFSEMVWLNAYDLLERIDMTQASWDSLLQAESDSVVNIIWDGAMNFARLVIAREVSDGVVMIVAMGSHYLVNALASDRLPPGAQLTISAESGQKITYIGADSIEISIPYDWATLQTIPEFQSVTLDGVRYDQYHIAMAEGKLHQLAFIPKNACGDGLVKPYFWLVFAVWFLAGLPVSMWIARISLHPVEKMLKKLPGGVKSARSAGEDELMFVDRIIRELDKKARTYADHITLQRHKINEMLLLRAIKGQMALGDEVRAACDEAHIIPTPGDALLMAGIRIDGPVPPDGVQGALTVYRAMDAQRLCYAQALSDMPHCFVGDNALWFLLIRSPEARVEAAIEQLRAHRIGDEEEIRPSFSIAVSQPADRIEALPTMYNQVLEIFHYMDWLGQYDALIRYDELTRNETPPRTDPLDLPEAIQNMVHGLSFGAFESATAAAEAVCTCITAAPQHFIDDISVEVSFVANQWAAAMERYIASAPDGALQSLAQKRLDRHAVTSMRSASDFERYAVTLLRELGALKQMTVGREAKLDMALQYIYENYADPALSATMVAARIDMSPSAFSKYFKQRMNVTYLEYVHRYRIQKAKEWLGNDQYNLNEIAERVGYTNSVTMNRAFKRYENITPGKLR